MKAVEFNTFAEITEAALCRRYTRGRIHRVICNAMLGNRFTHYVSPSYIRPLAFNENGAKILKEIKENSPLTVASRGAILKNDPVFQLECRATDLYSLIRGEKGGSEMRVAAAQAADELLSVRGVDASFAMFPENGGVHISARSYGALNVQLIMETLGGGGHQTMAATFLKAMDIAGAQTLLKKAIDAHLSDVARAKS